MVVNDIEYDCGWIGLDGTVYPCDYRFHYDMAEIICKNILKIDFYDPERKLEEIGFIKITKDLFHENEFMYLNEKIYSTRKQIEKLLELKLPLTKIYTFRLFQECSNYDLLEKAKEVYPNVYVERK